MSIILSLATVLTSVFMSMAAVLGINTPKISPPPQIVMQKQDASEFETVALEKQKEDLIEVIELLKNPKNFTQKGIMVPRGVLLYGSSGTGKTTLAKWALRTSDVNFIELSATQIGITKGFESVNKIFETAKKSAQNSAPCVIFIDDIDEIGGIFNNVVLNQLLAELNSLKPSDKVLFVAAASNIESLPPALLNSKRIGKKIFFNAPEKNQRIEILKFHAKNKKLSPNVNLEEIASWLTGATGGEIKLIMNEAAMLALREKSSVITAKHINEAFELLAFGGSENKNLAMSDKEKRMIAYHESGHAIVAYLCSKLANPMQITIVPRGTAFGYVSSPGKEVSLYTKSEILQMCMRSLGGMAAEEIIFGETTTGVTSDLETATRLVTKFVCNLGMSDIGLLVRDGLSGDAEEKASQILTDCYQETVKLLKNNVEILHELADYLMKHEKMTGEEFDKFMTEQLAKKQKTEVKAEVKEEKVA